MSEYLLSLAESVLRAAAELPTWERVARYISVIQAQAVSKERQRITEDLAGEIVVVPNPDSKFYNNGIYHAIKIVKKGGECEI